MKKSDRQKVFEKFGGRCAYCGCELQKGWHVDEIEPVKRNKVWDRDSSSWKLHPTEPFQHPDRMSIENQNPACASCNITKRSDDLEGFRNTIKKFVESLNNYSVQYKVAKRYGLITETGIEVKFYFELLNSEQEAQGSVATEADSSTDDGKQKL